MKVLIFFGTALLFVTAASAANIGLCPVATFDFYQTTFSIGGNTCNQGAFLFGDFLHVHQGGGEHPPSDITVNPTGNGFNFVFFGAEQTQTAGLFSNFNLDFSVQAPLVSGFNMGLRGTQVGSGNIDLTKQVCVGGTFGAQETCSGTLNGLNSLHANIPQDPADKSHAFVEGPQSTKFGMKDVFQISGGSPPSSSATLTSAFDNFNAVPEPGTLILMSLGLISVGALGRRRLKQQ